MIGTVPADNFGMGLLACIRSNLEDACFMILLDRENAELIFRLLKFSSCC
jgi:hypothetical protein